MRAFIDERKMAGVGVEEKKDMLLVENIPTPDYRKNLKCTLVYHCV